MNDEKVVHDTEGLSRLREAARKQGFTKLADGTWFQRMVSTHLKKHATEIGTEHWERVYPGLDTEARAQKLIKKAMRRAAAVGALASVGTSSGELLALFTEGLASPVGIPAALLSMFGEAAYTARLQLELASDLASVYGVPFDPNDVGELTTLFGLGLEVETEDKGKSGKEATNGAPGGVAATLRELDTGEAAKQIGHKLLEASFLKNVVPVFGIGISARWNYVVTRRFGAAAQKYARYRRALSHACARLDLKAVPDPGLLLQGAWLMATADGEAGHEELLALALVLESLPPAASGGAALDEAGDDEEVWFERLSQAPASMHDALLDVLYLVGATDRALASSEKRFLRRVGKVLHREIDLARIERFCAHLSEGEELPAGFYHCASA